MTQRVVLTGGPGAGKTTLLLALHARGHAVVAETARALIEARMKDGLSPRPPPLQFAHEILRQDIQKHRRPADESGPVFYDRGVVEALGMVDEVEPFEGDALGALLAAYPYHHQVFALPPWEAIYVNDAARDQSFGHAVRVHGLVVQWYRQCGYEVVEVPQATVAERCAHVLGCLSERGG